MGPNFSDQLFEYFAIKLLFLILIKFEIMLYVHWFIKLIYYLLNKLSWKRMTNNCIILYVYEECFCFSPSQLYETRQADVRKMCLEKWKVIYYVYFLISSWEEHSETLNWKKTCSYCWFLKTFIAMSLWLFLMLKRISIELS